MISGLSRKKLEAKNLDGKKGLNHCTDDLTTRCETMETLYVQKKSAAEDLKRDALREFEDKLINDHVGMNCLELEVKDQADGIAGKLNNAAQKSRNKYASKYCAVSALHFCLVWG
jgi:hypothetical protein